MTPEEFKIAVNVLCINLANSLPATEDENSLITYYMLSTGYEAFDYDGDKLDMPFSGLFLGQLMEVVIGEKNKLHKLNENIATSEPADRNYTTWIQTIRFTGEHLSFLLEQVHNDPIAWKAAQKLVAIFLRENRPLPEKLRLFAVIAMEQAPPRGKRGKHASVNTLRNVAIINCINALEENGYGPITKNDISEASLSICDAVSDALSILGIHLSYAAIATIYKRFQHLKDHVCAFEFKLTSRKSPIS